MSLKTHVDLLGCKCEDKITGLKGVIESISFDLYGCIQAVVKPPVGSDGKAQDGRWFDISRLIIKKAKRVMEVPNFNSGLVAAGKKGPADKPIP